MSTEKQYSSLEEMIKDFPEMENWKDNQGYVNVNATDDKMPDHSTCKGYPWTEVKTEIIFPHEKRFTEYEKVIIDTEKPNYVKIGKDKYMHKVIKELACKLIDAEHYLTVAEDQIKFMQEDSPFVPEEFGFVCVARPESITEAPIKIYQSKYEDKYSMHKVFGERYKWKILTKRDDMSFDEVEVYFPCHRVAYHYFVAVGVKVEENVKFAFSANELAGRYDYNLTNEQKQALSSYPLSNEEVFLDDKYHGAPINLSGEIADVTREANEIQMDALEAISPKKELTPETEPEITLEERLKKTRKDLGIGNK